MRFPEMEITQWGFFDSRIKFPKVIMTEPRKVNVYELELCTKAMLFDKMMRRRADVRLRVVLTGQHREMLDQVIEVFGIKADYDLEVMKKGQ